MIYDGSLKGLGWTFKGMQLVNFAAVKMAMDL
jgi:hypothetical protein